MKLKCTVRTRIPETCAGASMNLRRVTKVEPGAMKYILCPVELIGLQF
jgi:hypothetical protein